ncbi:MAG: M28 family metallopeptidase [Acidobacteriota bacterium]
MRQILRTLALVVLVWPTAIAVAQTTTPTGRPSRTALQAHQNFLADDFLKGRDTGSPEYEIAARYVAAQFQSSGLKPAGDDNSFLQAVPLRRTRLDVDSARVDIRNGDSPTELEWKQDFLMGGDAERQEVSITAPVVFVGHGVSAPDQGYDDYANVDVEGKIVLWISGAPSSFPSTERAYYSEGTVKTEDAVERGAVGILSFSTAEMAERYPWERITKNADSPGYRWLDEDQIPSSYYPQIQGSAYLSHEAAAKLLTDSGRTLDEILEADAENRLESFDLGVEVTIARRTSYEGLTAPNVAALLPGGDAKLRKEYVVYTAHLDHEGIGEPEEGDAIYNGAYDNAMGIALLIEIARLFAAAPEPPKRSILFLAVTAEEKGLLGAEYFVHNPTVPLESIVANVNFDMPLFLYPIADVTAFGAEHSSLAAPVAAAAKAAGFEVTPDPMPEEALFIRSDQYPFVQMGIPSLYFVPGMQSTDASVDGRAITMDFLTNHYHTPSDDLSLPIDWESAEKFALANYLLGLKIANDWRRPTWNEGDFFGKRFGR